MSPFDRERKLRFVVKIHFWVTFFSFAAYLALGFFIGPQFFFADIRQKLSVFADDIVITAVVPGPPATPVVTATPSCVSLSPRITLDWADDIGTTSWDIDRDSTPLTTGVTTSQYADTAVTANVTYTYVVTAYGPMSPGSAVSSPVSATALDCPALAPMEVRIETLGGKNVSQSRNDIDLTRQRPRVTGTANTPYAIIDISVTNPSMSAQLTANVNGYFEWVPPMKLDTGNHYLTVIATDPNDSSRTANDSFIFRTRNDGDDDEKGGSSTGTTEIMTPRGAELDLWIRINNEDKTASAEEALSVSVGITNGVFPDDARLSFMLNDASRQDVLRLPFDSHAGGKDMVTFEADIPHYLEPGLYHVRVDASLDGEVVSREVLFRIEAVPFLTLGGRALTYVEAASILGFVFLLSLSLFVFLLLLFIREYWLYLHSLRAITERHLRLLGFITRRKGVMR